MEFLHDILKVDAFPWARFPHRVGLHNSCGTLRRLKHALPSELNEPFFSEPLDLLSKVEGISRSTDPIAESSGRSLQAAAVRAVRKPPAVLLDEG